MLLFLQPIDANCVVNSLHKLQPICREITANNEQWYIWAQISKMFQSSIWH